MGTALENAVPTFRKPKGEFDYHTIFVDKPARFIERSDGVFEFNKTFGKNKATTAFQSPLVRLEESDCENTPRVRRRLGKKEFVKQIFSKPARQKTPKSISVLQLKWKRLSSASSPRAVTRAVGLTKTFQSIHEENNVPPR